MRTAPAGVLLKSKTWGSARRGSDPINQRWSTTMPDLGDRGNVMGPQPIAQPRPFPPEMFVAATVVMELLAAGKRGELAAIATPQAAGENAAPPASIGAGY